MTGRIAGLREVRAAIAVGLSGCAVPPPPLDLDGGTSSGGTSTAELTTGTTAELTTGTTTEPTPGTSTDFSTTDVSTTSELSVGSSSSSAGEETTAATTTGAPACDMGLVECGGDCIDPLVDTSFCGATDPCALDPGTSCVPIDEICLTGTCSHCQLRFNFEIGMDAVGSLAGWNAQGTWAPYGGTPVTTLAPVAFGQTVYGITGQGNGGNETSYVVMSPVTGGATLSFRSWNVDRGGDNLDDLDNKIIEAFILGSWQTLVNCGTGINAHLPFCDFVGGPRAADDWDHIVLAVPSWVGPSQLRFTYDANQPQVGFEQGWYIDDIRVGDDCGPPS